MSLTERVEELNQNVKNLTDELITDLSNYVPLTKERKAETKTAMEDKLKTQKELIAYNVSQIVELVMANQGGGSGGGGLTPRSPGGRNTLTLRRNQTLWQGTSPCASHASPFTDTASAFFQCAQKK